jgi:hypothetical protein
MGGGEGGGGEGGSWGGAGSTVTEPSTPVKTTKWLAASWPLL